MLHILPLLIPSPIYAQDVVPVLISGFQGQDAASVPVAMDLPDVLADVLANQEDLELLRLGRAPAIHDQSASLYLEACPDGQVVGCTFVVGEAADAAFALTGTVRQHGEAPLPLEDGAPPPPPELMVELVHACLEGDLARAKEAQRTVAPLARLIYDFGEPGCGAHQRMKVARWLLGGISSPVFRRPVRPLPEAEVQRMRERLKGIGMKVVR